MKYTIYASDRYKNYFEKTIRNIFFFDSVPVQSISNATIIIDSKQHIAVFDSNNKLVSSSTQTLNKITQIIPEYKATDKFLDIEAVYLGTLESHFGHFLLEHTNRFYPLTKRKYQNKKYIIVNNNNIQNIPSFIFDFLLLLGIPKSDILIINSSIKIKKLYIPNVAFEIPNHSSKKFADTFDFIAKNIKSTSKYNKIYVSRMKMGERSTFGEKQIQKVFSQNGFKVIYPEQLSLKKQIQYMKNCKCLAGIAGSALHLSLFMSQGGQVIQIKRNKLLKDNADIQYILCASKNCDFTLVDCNLEKLPTHHWSEFPQIIGPTKFFINFIRDYKFKYYLSDIICDKSIRKNYRKAFRTQGGLIRYQLKRMLVVIIPSIIPIKKYKPIVKLWLNKHL